MDINRATSSQVKEIAEKNTEQSSYKGWVVLLLLLLVLAVTNPKEDDFSKFAMGQTSDGAIEELISGIGESVLKAMTSSNDYVIFTIFTVDTVFEQKKFLGVGKVIFIPIN